MISIPTALVTNFKGLLALRFLQGFFGSPCLATGGASLQDAFSEENIPFSMIIWVAAGSAGPVSLSLKALSAILS